MDKKTFVLAALLILIVVPAAMAAYATFRHSAFAIGDGKDIDLMGNRIGNGTFTGNFSSAVNISNASQNESYGYIIWTNGVNTYSKNGTTGLGSSNVDAYTVIQAAVQDVRGKLYIRAGNYTINNTIKITDTDELTELVGEYNKTILIANMNSSADVIEISNATGSTAAPTNIIVDNLQINANYTMARYGIYLDWRNPVGERPQNIKIRNNMIYNTASHGMLLSNTFDLEVTGNYIVSPGFDGIETRYTERSTYEKNHVFYPGRDCYFVFHSINEFTMSNNYCRFPGEYGIRLYDDPWDGTNSTQDPTFATLVTGNHIIGNASTDGGIFLRRESRNNIISQNTILNISLVGGYGITLESVTANSSGYENVSTQNLIINNIIGVREKTDLGVANGIKLMANSTRDLVYGNIINATTIAITDSGKDNYVYNNYPVSPFYHGASANVLASLNKTAFGAGDTWFNSTRGLMCISLAAGTASWSPIGNSTGGC